MSKKYLSKVNAAYEILKEYPEGLTYKEIIDISLENKMIRTNGKTPDATLRVDILNENKRRETQNREKRFEILDSGRVKIIV